MTNYIAAEGVSPDNLKPYQKEGTDAQKVASLKAFKTPIGKLHLYTAYFIMILSVLHIIAVVRAEIKQGDHLVSSMISGNKIIREKPQDE